MEQTFVEQAPVVFNYSSGFSLLLTLATLAGLYKTFEKMGEPGWKGIVPFYNMYILFQKVWDLNYFFFSIVLVAGMLMSEFLALLGAVQAENGSYILLVVCVLLFLACLIAFFIINIMLDVRLAKAFNKNGWFAFGLIIMPAVFYLILGFDEEKFVYREHKSEWRKMDN